jgi:hypothetical protein
MTIMKLLRRSNMRRLALFFTLLLSILALPLAAQEVELYAKSVYIYKVYPHPKGYVILYYKNNGRDLSSLHLPREWFNRKTAQSFDGSSKAEMHYGDGPTIPYMQIFWKEGSFHHLKLFVRPDQSRPMWGVIPDASTEDDKFVVDEDPEFFF